MRRADMLKAMCMRELAQVDIKAICQSRGFEPEVARSRPLLEHVYLSEQGVRAALGSLTSREILGLHLLHQRDEAVGLEFFGRVYPDRLAGNLYVSHTARYKGVLQQVRTNLIRRGILLFCSTFDPFREKSVSERLQFHFPSEFGPFLPPPFAARRVAATAKRNYRKEVARDKLAEILKLDSASGCEPEGSDVGSWKLMDGELLFGGKPFSVEGFRAWPRNRLAADFPGSGKESTEAFEPVPLLRYALSRLGEDEWVASDDLLPLWELGLRKGKVPKPEAVCEAGVDYGLLESAEQEGTRLYRWRGLDEGPVDMPAEQFLRVENGQETRIELDHVPLDALACLGKIAQFEVADGSLWAVPSLLKISHAGAATLEGPVVGWLRENHPAFRAALETVEQRRGNLIVHENLLVAKVNDPALKVKLDREFGAAGRLVTLANGYVAFPGDLLPQIQAWMKRSGHVIKSVTSDESD